MTRPEASNGIFLRQPSTHLSSGILMCPWRFLRIRQTKRVSIRIEEIGISALRTMSPMKTNLRRIDDGPENMFMKLREGNLAAFAAGIQATSRW
jgi:hypothetical protein